MDGLECLGAVASAGRPLGCRELARMLGMEPTRVHRLLKTLSHMGICSQTDLGKYLPGPGMQVLAAQSVFGSGLMKKALPHLVGLRRLRMVSALGVLWRDKVSYFYHNAPGISVENSIGRAGLFPATRSSIGMVLLSRKSDHEIRKTYSGRDIIGFPGGIGSLLSEIREIRRKGAALVVQDDGALSISVPVGDAHFAMALSGRMERSVAEEYVAVLKETAEKIAMPEDNARRPAPANKNKTKHRRRNEEQEL